MEFLYLLVILSAVNTVRVLSASVNIADPALEKHNGVLRNLLSYKASRSLNKDPILNLDISEFKQRLASEDEKWTSILRRQDGSVDFYRNWADYQYGFGNPDGDFFIGLDNLHNLTASGKPQELLILLGDWKNLTAYAKYDLFEIGNAEEKYALKELGTYSGTAGDSLSYHKGMEFTTRDQDNDLANHNCAITYKGAWWFNNCRQSHLMGIYRPIWEATEVGITWYGWKGNYYYINYAEMLIRDKPSETNYTFL